MACSREGELWSDRLLFLLCLPVWQNVRFSDHWNSQLIFILHQSNDNSESVGFEWIEPDEPAC